METIIGIILLVAAVFLVASVLLQSSKSHKLPGAIAGGAETFFGKTKGSKLDRVLEIATIVVAIIFCLLVLTLYITQETIDYSAILDSMDTTATETQDISAMTPNTPEETGDPVDTTDVADTADVADTTDAADTADVADTTDVADTADVVDTTDVVDAAEEIVEETTEETAA